MPLCSQAGAEHPQQEEGGQSCAYKELQLISTNVRIPPAREIWARSWCRSSSIKQDRATSENLCKNYN